MSEYTIEKTVEGREISRKEFKSSNLRVVYAKPGLCKANPDNPAQDRSIEWYSANVLKPLIEANKIGDGSKGPFDDRKMRYHQSEFREIPDADETKSPISVLDIHLGHSYYGEPGFTPETGDQLTRLGNEHFQNPYALFPRVPGVTGVIWAEGMIFVGDRMEGKAMAGYLQGAAGFVEYREDPSEVSFHNEMLKELLEETGITRDQVLRVEPLGLFSDPSVNGDDLDKTYLIRTNLPAAYLSEGHWKKHIKKKERDHNEFYAISDFGALEKLTKTGELNGKNWPIVFSTQGPLEQLTAEDFN